MNAAETGVAHHSPAAPELPGGSPACVPGRREIASEELFRGGKSIVIRHDGATYRLLVTRHNRLILQK